MCPQKSLCLTMLLIPSEVRKIFTDKTIFALAVNINSVSHNLLAMSRNREALSSSCSAESFSPIKLKSKPSIVSLNTTFLVFNTRLT